MPINTPRDIGLFQPLASMRQVTMETIANLTEGNSHTRWHYNYGG